MIYFDNLRSLRVNKKITLQDMASFMHTSISYVSNIESGKNVPSVDRLEKYLNRLGLTLSYKIDDPKNFFNV